MPIIYSKRLKTMSLLFTSPPPFNTLHSIRDWLRWSVSRFYEGQLAFGHGCTTAYDEAAYLILHTLHLPPTELEPFLDAQLTQEEKLAIYALIKARVETRKPAAYLTHEAWLKDFKFYVDERVIVPRSLIAQLLLEEELGFIHPWIESMSEAPKTLLDLCTGSGCLAIVLAHLFPDAHVDAVDLSLDALDVARKNVAHYQLEQRLTLYHGDLYAPLAQKRYDLIISNPPYVTMESVRHLPQEYLHEPTMALGAGEDGLDCVRPILEHAREHLNPEGLLVVEIGHNRHIVEEAFPELPFVWFEAEEQQGHVFLLAAADL
jgi:ribosomal protein L3 glutamine methyltransferase